MIIWGIISISIIAIGFILGPNGKEATNQIDAIVNCFEMVLVSIGCAIMAYILAILDNSVCAIVLVSVMAGVAYYFFVLAMQSILDYMRCSSEVPDYCKIIKK